MLQTRFARMAIVVALFLTDALRLPTVFAAQPPNVVVILTDDQGWGDLSVNGNTNLSTPRIDSLARDGASFDRFFVCPVCSPTRAEWLTGRYHPRGGVYSTSSGGERLDLDEQTIAETFRAAGYRTAAFGKWHNGMQPPYHPNARGFDEFYGFCSGHWGHYFSPMLEHNGRIVQGDGFLADDFTNHAIHFIEEHRSEPFFVYLPYNTPHSPMQVPDRWWKPFKNKPITQRHRDPKQENVDFTRAALAMCENIDWNTGRVLDTLTRLKLDDNTIVLYFCDNGPNSSRWNGGMKGRKGSTDEGGVRSPLLIRWPDRIAAGRRIPQIAAAIDLLPTLADLAGIPVISREPLDGVSLKPLLTTRSDAESSWSDRLLFSHWNGRVSVRSQQYRLDHQGALFDLQADHGQAVDISSEQPEVANQMRSAAAAWKEELLPQLKVDQRPFTLGHPDFQFTQIPARDGTSHGGIRRSNKFPNCSYFTNWTQLQDRITWGVEVATDGDYQVDLYYTCPADDVGAKFQLQLNGSVIQGQVTEAFDPPLVGAADDRIVRGESYVKDFKSLPLGILSLKAGPGELSLQATHIPGAQVMDFRLLMFTRVATPVDARR